MSESPYTMDELKIRDTWRGERKRNHLKWLKEKRKKDRKISRNAYQREWRR